MIKKNAIQLSIFFLVSMYFPFSISFANEEITQNELNWNGANEARQSRINQINTLYARHDCTGRYTLNTAYLPAPGAKEGFDRYVYGAYLSSLGSAASEIETSIGNLCPTNPVSPQNTPSPTPTTSSTPTPNPIPNPIPTPTPTTTTSTTLSNSGPNTSQTDTSSYGNILAQKLESTLRNANNRIIDTYLKYYCGSGFGPKETIVRYIGSSYEDSTYSLEGKAIESEAERILRKITTQCTLIELPGNPTSISKSPQTSNDQSKSETSTAGNESILIEINYNTAIALFSNLQYKYQLERGTTACGNAPMNFSAKEFLYFGNPSTSNLSEKDRYDEWVRYIYTEYDKSIKALIDSCGLTGTKVREIQLSVTPAPITAEPPTNSGQQLDQSKPVVQDSFDSTPSKTNWSKARVTSALKQMSEVEIQSQLSIKTTSKTITEFVVNTSFSNLQLKLVGTKKGFRSIEIPLKTDSDGDASVKIKRNLVGYTFTLRYGNVNLDKDKFEQRK